MVNFLNFMYNLLWHLTQKNSNFVQFGDVGTYYTAVTLMLRIQAPYQGQTKRTGWVRSWTFLIWPNRARLDTMKYTVSPDRGRQSRNGGCLM